MFGRCLESVWFVYGIFRKSSEVFGIVRVLLRKCFRSVWGVLGKCLGDAWGCLGGVSGLFGGCSPSVWDRFGSVRFQSLGFDFLR